VNAWTRHVIEYLELRRDAGDGRARSLLARGPRPAPAKSAVKSVAFAAARRRREERESEQESAEIRSAVFARAAGRCELCNVGFDFLDPRELAHLNGGIGRRVQKQSVSNCMAAHQTCHKSLDKYPLSYLSTVTDWCSRHGYPLPERWRILGALR
jgi:5-methylcytosine-specific restriction endonuclease McrA